MRYTRGAGVAALGLIAVLVGCSSYSGATETIAPELPAMTPIELVAPDGWIEPAWMAPAREAVAAYQTEFVACLASHGVEGVKAVGSPSVFAIASTDENGSTTRESREQAESASVYCSHAVALPAHFPQAPDFQIVTSPEAYERMLDVRSCLVAHGHDIPDAPEMDTWVRSSWPWNPWISESIGALKRSDPDGLRALGVACPQDGVSPPVSYLID